MIVLPKKKKNTSFKPLKKMSNYMLKKYAKKLINVNISRWLFI